MFGGDRGRRQGRIVVQAVETAALRLREIGIEGQRAVEGGDRFAHQALILKHEGEVPMRDGGVGLQLDGPPARGRGRRQPTEVPQDVAAEFMNASA